MKKTFITIYCFLVFYALPVNALCTDELVLILETSSGETRFCQGSSFSITARGFHGDEVLVGHRWESPTEGLIARTEGPYALIEAREAGAHKITYYGTDDQGNHASISITIEVLPNPISEIEISKSFFTRLFNRDFPQNLQSLQQQEDYQYAWYLNNEWMAHTATFRANQPGRYRLVITSSQGCRSYSQPLTIP